ncbi:MAG TPA: hypothetical protein VEA16_04470 [Vicinamibacterales bacterium]|nr:hypothetical protein [Vicinamibacterales bacterium]
MAASPGVDADIRKVLADAGIPETSDAVIKMLSGGAPTTSVGSCSEAIPQEGTMVECDFQRGATLEWMSYRPNIGKRDRTPQLLRKFRWAGRQTFRAFLFRVTSNNRTYTFVVPKPCGNLSLMSMVEAPRPTPPPPAPAPVVAPPAPAPAPRLEPKPAPAPEPPVMQVAPVAAVARHSPFFVDFLGGKERRTRPISGLETIAGAPVSANADGGGYAQCSPLLGVKFGVAKRFANDVELAGSAGVALSLVSDDNKVREHQLFVDVELNKYLGRGFIGTGISAWDVTDGDTITPAVLLQFGVPLTASDRVHFIGQGRMFLDHADDVRNNYLVWGGVRLRF